MFWRDEHYRRLPDRVQVRLHQYQRNSELLIALIQLWIFILFAVLYSVSPKTFSADSMFAPVPSFLGAYLVITLTRLGLVWTDRLPDWFVYASVIFDIALLYGLMWTFHIQYDQPAAFYLKAPTLLYVFIFIAIRALRFEVRFVLLSGIVAAIGWLLMAGYAIYFDPRGVALTRDYVTYLTSNVGLLGAEVDKIVSIIVVTLTICVAIGRARRMLVRAIVEEGTARELSRFVPARVAEQVSLGEESASTGHRELRDATVLFTDIEKFTTVAESMTPEQLIDTLNEYFSVVGPVIERHGGVINQYQGDAILATFNLPDPLENHQTQAVRAAIAVQQSLAQHRFARGLSLRTRIGINTGPIVGGFVGSGDRLGYTVHGDVVNAASRLEQINKHYGTTIAFAHSTFEALGDMQQQCRLLDEVQLDGKQSATRVYTVAPT